jgi:predicted ABC-type sugar transport system permease subunit
MFRNVCDYSSTSFSLNDASSDSTLLIFDLISHKQLTNLPYLLLVALIAINLSLYMFTSGRAPYHILIFLPTASRVSKNGTTLSTISVACHCFG